MKVGNYSNGGGRPPEFVLKVGLRGERYHKRVGAAWRTKDGQGLNIKLDPGIALVGANDISITLWKSDEQQQRTQQSPPPPPQQQPTIQDDDIPF